MKTPDHIYPNEVELAGSYIEAPAEQQISNPRPDKKIQITAILFWDNIPPDPVGRNGFLSREEFEEKYNIAQEKFLLFKAFADTYCLQLDLSSGIKRYVTIKGRVADFESAFSVKLGTYITRSGKKFISHAGSIMIPRQLCGIVEAIIGFDDRPKIAAYISGRTLTISPYFTPQQVADIYGFPAKVTGKNQCIALLQFGGGYNEADMQHYFQHNKLKMPDLHWVGVNGARNSPSNSSIDCEVAMNIQVAGSIANDTKIVVYFAPNTDDGFLSAFAAAVHDKTHRPTVISISWGAPEKKWSATAMNVVNELCRNAATLGITICAAAGNKGMQDGVNDGEYHVDFPASSPYVLACGGTRLRRIRSTISETPWRDAADNAGGSGISAFFPKPQYQENIEPYFPAYTHAFNGRAVPDVAGSASPHSGYPIYVHSKWSIIAGTSSVAPLYAGLVARLNELYDTCLGFVNPILYKDPTLCRPLLSAYKLNKRNKQNKNAAHWNVTTGLGVFYRTKHE